MAIVAGIDEAGYGPLLGPLVVSGAVFEVPDDRADESLWDLLSGSVTRHVRKHDPRLPVIDSKKLHQSKKGLSNLERTALGMFASSQPIPATMRALLTKIAPQSIESLGTYPWYRNWDEDLPGDADANGIRLHAASVSRDALAAGVRLAGVVCEPLLEGHYNKLVGKTRNKSLVLLSLTLRIIQRIIRRAAGRRTIIHIDRQGGRSRYAEWLMTSFTGMELEVIEESDHRSAYRMRRAPVDCRVEFRVEGEASQLPIALASVYSKYVRELLMRGFNAYWSEKVKDLSPTAGYYTDAQRFLGDIGRAVEREGIDRAILVRSR